MNLLKQELNVMTPRWSGAWQDRVGAIFTEREGGVSSGSWGGQDGIMGMNVGIHVNDNAACVAMNRRILTQALPAQPRWMTQVHGVRVLEAEQVSDESVQADAQTSVTPGVICAVQVADCLPVLLAQVDGTAVAAVHAGWRSLSAGIIEATLDSLRTRLGDPQAQFRAWLGPRIGFDDFETGAEVADAFTRRYPQYPAGVKRLESGKYLVDLAGFAREALTAQGVCEIDDCALSTVACPQRFYSYRRDGAQTGRHAALIWIKKTAESSSAAVSD